MALFFCLLYFTIFASVRVTRTSKATRTTTIRTVANSLPENEAILLTFLISKRYIPHTDLQKNFDQSNVFCSFSPFFRTNDDSGTPEGGVPLSSLQAVRAAISTRNRRARPRLPARRTPRRAPSGRAVRSRLSASARSGTPSGNGCRAARGPATR